jgi:hypothetical protein
MTHYLVTEGFGGCLSDYIESYDTLTDAREAARDMIYESKDIARDAGRTCGYRIGDILRFGITWDNTRYIEVVECDCDNPEDHNY